jgi:pimeloyl-ACP methyl ester carboxylesterase
MLGRAGITTDRDPPVLLVMGLGSQMLAWPDDLCSDLAARGHFVIRFDNRDVGLPTHLRALKRRGRLLR